MNIILGQVPDNAKPTPRSVRVRWERVPSELGGKVFRGSWVGTCPVDVRWERVPSELGGNVSRASRVRKGIVQVGWERSPSELGGNVSHQS